MTHCQVCGGFSDNHYPNCKARILALSKYEAADRAAWEEEAMRLADEYAEYAAIDAMSQTVDKYASKHPMPLDWQPTLFHGEQIGIEVRSAEYLRYQIAFAPITVYIVHDQVGGSRASTPWRMRRRLARRMQRGG